MYTLIIAALASSVFAATPSSELVLPSPAPSVENLDLGPIMLNEHASMTEAAVDKAADPLGFGEAAADNTPESLDTEPSAESEQLMAKRRVAPNWPSEALSKGIDLDTCTARIDVDKRGKPYNVVVSDCSEVFHENVEFAAMKWRFYPLIVDDVPQESSTAMKFTFRRI